MTREKIFDSLTLCEPCALTSLNLVHKANHGEDIFTCVILYGLDAYYTMRLIVRYSDLVFICWYIIMIYYHCLLLVFISLIYWPLFRFCFICRYPSSRNKECLSQHLIATFPWLKDASATGYVSTLFSWFVYRKSS